MQGDEFGNLAEFGGPTLDVKYSFSNFSFKVKQFVDRLILIVSVFFCSFTLNFMLKEHHKNGWQKVSSISTSGHFDLYPN